MSITVYHSDGRILNVPNSKLDSFIEKGFSLEKPSEKKTEPVVKSTAAPKPTLKKVTRNGGFNS